MFVDSLLNLSVKAVAKCLCEGHYKHLDFSLGESLSDKVFDEVAKTKHNFHSSVSSIIAKQSGLKLNLTRFDSNSFCRYCFDIGNLYLHNIQSLLIDFRWFRGLTEYIIGYIGEIPILDVTRILKKCLNEKSRQNLKELALRGDLEFQGNWIEDVGKLFPNLQYFDCQFDHEHDFERAFKSFPNLITFESSNLNDLRGVRHLKHLQILTILFSCFESPIELRELFDLPNLRLLDVSNCFYFFEDLLRCPGTFQNLRFIKCDDTEFTETQLRELVRRYKTLETISLLDTPCDYTDLSDLPVKILNLATFESTMSTLSFFFLDRRLEIFGSTQVRILIDRLTVLLENKTIRGFKEEEFLKMMMTITLKFPHLARDENRVANCLISYFEHFFPDQTINVILKNLDPKHPLFIDRRWAAQTILRYFEERHPI